MSSITGLISGGGGGAGGGETHIKTDPRQLTRIAAANLLIKASESTSESAQTANFYSLLSQNIQGATVDVTASDTYVNLLNITSAANGGYLHWVISPGVRKNANLTSYIRITVDGGTAYEFAYNYQSTNNTHTIARFVMGGGYSNASFPAGTTTSTYHDFWNSYFSEGINTSDTYNSTLIFQDSTNQVYGSSFQQVYLLSDFGLLNSMPFERLKFESSILVEVKQATLDTPAAGNKAGCFYSLK